MRRIRRDRLKIYMDILLVIKRESRENKIILTRIQQKSNVSFDRLKIYLSELKNLGLIDDTNMPRLTGKGFEYLSEYQKVIEFTRRMGLTY